MLLTKREGQTRWWVDTDHFKGDETELEGFEEFKPADVWEGELIPTSSSDVNKLLLQGCIISVRTTETMQMICADGVLLWENLQ